VKVARDVMQPAITVGPHTSLRALAEALLAEKADGACVLEAGKLIGVVTTMDLVFREKKIHLPTLFTLLDAVIPLGGMDKLDAEVSKIAAANVGQLMTRKVVAVPPTTPMEEVASLMVERNLTLVPVVDGDSLLGVVTKQSLLAGSGLMKPA
jgi:CBS domain-containing protein